MKHEADRIKATVINCFHQCFQNDYQTILRDIPDKEPVYLPKSQTGSGYNHIQFANGFWSSALHEIAHWCIAGQDRHKLVDYGYWYKPDDRNALEQMLFESVEAKPQALEWIFASALGQDFFVSFDNLRGNPGSGLSFRQLVFNSALAYLDQGMPKRSSRFQKALLTVGKVTLEDFETYWREIRSDRRLPL